MYRKIRGPAGKQWLGDYNGSCFRSSSDPSRKIRVTLRHKEMDLDLVIPPRYRKKPWRGLGEEEDVEEEDVPKGEEKDAPKVEKKDDDVDTEGHEDHDEFQTTPKDDGIPVSH